MKISIRAARVNAGLSQAQLAKKLGKSTSTICRLEKGLQTITVSDLKTICAACGVKEKDIDLDNNG